MRQFYTTFEAARILGVSLPTVVNWIKARRLKAHRTPGGHRRIAREELAAFMLRQGMPLPPDLSGAAPSRRKALVVGDAGAAREGAARQLAQVGWAVDQASHGFAAGAAAARFEPDLIVLQASGPDGGETLRALRLDRELTRVPVVAVGSADWVDALREAGCTSALAQPLGDGDLTGAAEAAITAAGAARERGAPGRPGRRRTPD